mmetsp:Transcript_13538/g.20937  ORF Transcript_13538/g.20937 Transcript_13538/m.20937 type:complete len:294 (-) Transcript_13538:463-1344(-)
MKSSNVILMVAKDNSSPQFLSLENSESNTIHKAVLTWQNVIFTSAQHTKSLVRNDIVFLGIGVLSGVSAVDTINISSEDDGFGVHELTSQSSNSGGALTRLKTSHTDNRANLEGSGDVLELEDGLLVATITECLNEQTSVELRDKDTEGIFHTIVSSKFLSNLDVLSSNNSTTNNSNNTVTLFHHLLDSADNLFQHSHIGLTRGQQKGSSDLHHDGFGFVSHCSCLLLLLLLFLCLFSLFFSFFFILEEKRECEWGGGEERRKRRGEDIDLILDFVEFFFEFFQKISKHNFII